MTKETLARFETTFLTLMNITKEEALKELIDSRDDLLQIMSVLTTSNYLEIAHTAYHSIESLRGCQVASDLLISEAFILGFKCGKAMEEQDALSKLVSICEA